MTGSFKNMPHTEYLHPSAYHHDVMPRSYQCLQFMCTVHQDIRELVYLQSRHWCTNILLFKERKKERSSQLFLPVQIYAPRMCACRGALSHYESELRTFLWILMNCFKGEYYHEYILYTYTLWHFTFLTRRRECQLCRQLICREGWRRQSRQSCRDPGPPLQIRCPPPRWWRGGSRGPRSLRTTTRDRMWRQIK